MTRTCRRNIENIRNIIFYDKHYVEHAIENGYVLDITDSCYHHEIDLSDASKVEPGKMKTVIRHPIKKI